MSHERLPKIVFGSIVDKTSRWASSIRLWLIPILNGDRDVVPNNDSALTINIVACFTGRIGLPSSAMTSILYLSSLPNLLAGPRLLSEDLLDPEG